MASTHHALIDVRFVMEGSEIIYGVRTFDLEGASLKDKHTAMSAMTWATFLQLVKSKGFAVQVKAGSAVAIPAGFGIVIVNKGPAVTHGLRWQVAGSVKRMTDTLRSTVSIMVSWPTVGESYKVVRDFVKPCVDAA